MAELTPRRNGELLRAVFKILVNEPDGLQAKEVLARLGDQLRFTEFELGSYPSSPGAPRWHKILRFASIPIVKAGWLTKEKGKWSVTEEGREAYQTLAEPEAFYRGGYRLYQTWRSARPKEDLEGEDLDEQVERVRVSYEQAQEESWQEISAFLQGMDPYAFQDLVGDLLSAMGYHVSWIAPRGKDFGIDIIAFTDPVGAAGPRIKVQVKRREEAVRVEELKSFLSALAEGDLGIFVTTGNFTKDAEDEARRQERRRIKLLDLGKFVELWIEYYPKIKEEARQRFPLRPVHFLALEE